VLRTYATTGQIYAFDNTEGQERARQISEELFNTRGVSVSEEAAWELLDAIRWHVPRWNLKQWEVLKLPDGTPLVEHDLVLPWDDDIELAAIVDVVFRHRATGRVWLVDWKTTTYNIDSTLRPYVEHDVQLAIQRTLLAAYNIHVDVSALCRIRSLAPKIPFTTSRGKLTRDKSKLACDWPTYEAALVENNEPTDTADVLAVRDHLLSSTFVQWCVDITTPDAQAAIMKLVTRTALEMREYARQAEDGPVAALRVAVPRYINATLPRKGCNDCENQPWCEAGLRQGGKADLRQLAINFRLTDESPLKTLQIPDDTGPTADEMYVRFAAEHGRTINHTQEFKP
jgi:hypothetical protein